MIKLEALVPRSLILPPKDAHSVRANFEGLSHICLGLDYGKIQTLEVVNSSEITPKKILLPRLIEPHAHLDKAFSWPAYPNLSGHYSEALRVNYLEHQTRTKMLILERVECALELSLKNGIRAIRTHVDVFDPIGLDYLDVFIGIRNQWKSKIEIQVVALASIDYWGTEKGREFAKNLARVDGLLGGVISPTIRGSSLKEDIKKMLILAEGLGCEIDLHIDESQIKPAVGLHYLLGVLDEMTITIPVTCSHASSLALLPSRLLLRISERMAAHNLRVVALPLTNSWLLGGRRSSVPSNRPIAPIRQLQSAGVIVAVGGDNVQDSWFPGGNFDPLGLMGFSLPIAQLAPWERLGLAPFTTSAAKIMGLSWDGTFQVGSPADFILLEADSWVVALAAPPERKVMIGGDWVNQKPSAR